MKINLKQLWQKITSPLLFYVDKSGNSIFRNYCIYKNDGCFYSETFSIQKAGKVLEYRMELDKKLKRLIFLISFIVYLIFIKTDMTFLSFVVCEIVWLFAYFSFRIYFAYLYKNKLKSTFGDYKIVNFDPQVSKNKRSSFYYHFASKIVSVFIIILLFFFPALILFNIIKINLNSSKPSYKFAVGVSRVYGFLYPKTVKYYDMSVYAKYMIQDFEGALRDCKKSLEKSGIIFRKRDMTRFANLLYLTKKIYGSETAIEYFNDYITRKNMSLSQQIKMLWMKSMFSISGQITEYIEQDYDDLLLSLNKKDYKNRFYILCDKAYMYYLMGEYEKAIKLYNELIPYAQNNTKDFEKESHTLIVERGYAKRQNGDYISADTDFNSSGIELYDLEKYEPVLLEQNFIVQKF